MSPEPIHVANRLWLSMAYGALFERWPATPPPEVGQRVVIFDRALDFTQHDVIWAEGHRVAIGPAIPWPDEP